VSQSLTALYLQNPELANALRRREEGARLAQMGADASPILHPLQGVARIAQALMGGYDQRKGDEAITAEGDRQRRQNDEFMQAAMTLYGAPQSPPQSPPPAESRPPLAQPMTAPTQPVQSQFLPPTGVDPDEDLLVRTVYGEARGEPAEGQQAVAAVVRNRAKVAGVPVRDIVFAPGQFEPWGNPQTRAQLEALDPASPEYQQILQNIRAGGDPTGGKTHFYSPTAQAAAGRPPPAWAQGEGQDIGRHRFYDLPYSYRGPAQPAAQPGETIPAQMPQQGQGAPVPTRAQSAADAAGEIQHWQGLAMRAQAAGNHGMATLFMQRAQMAQQMAALRAPQPTENERLLMAAGLQPGTPEYQKAALDLVAAKARGQSVTVGGGMTIPTAPPPGYAYVRRPTPDGGDSIALEPIPGGEAARKQQKEDKAETTREESKARAGGVVIEDIGRIEKQLADAWLPATGFGATTLSNIPGTAASDVSSLLDGIGANIAFDKLQEMRASSPTGAALGAVSDRENMMLQSVYGSLKQSQTEKQFRENLTRLRKIYLDIVHGPGQWTETAPGQPPAPPPGFVPVQPR